jgi:hypothetical protein
MKKEDEFKKVRLFLKELEPVQFRYLELTMQLASNLQDIIKRNKLSKEDFCKHFEIKPAKYNDYIKGNYNYSVNDMAMLNAVYHKLEIERIKKEEIIKVGTETE